MKTPFTLLALSLCVSSALAQMQSTPADTTRTDQTTYTLSSGSSGTSGNGATSAPAAAPAAALAARSTVQFASDSATPGMLPPAAPALARMEPKTENGVTYICGGTGLDESTAMKAAAKEHDLMLTFATQKGNYMADVKVEIADSKGQQVLSTSCDGPIMLVDLPASGTYRVHSSAEGYDNHRTVTVNTNKRMAAQTVLRYPQALANDPVNVTSTGASAGMGESETGAADARPKKKKLRKTPAATEQ